MAIGLVGQKLGMMRLLSDDGSASSVSVIKIEPNRIVQTKTIDTDGYNAVQVTFGKKINKKGEAKVCLLYTSPSPRDGLLSRMPSSA